MELWICGQYRSGGDNGVGDVVWDFQGVFSTRAKALAACRNRNYFIAPVVLDREVPDETEEMPGYEYPLHKKGT